MIKAVLFDLDGVLVDAQRWHYQALNKALALFGYEISEAEHEQVYNGLPTRTKLQMLTERVGFPRSLHNLIHSTKQNVTNHVIDEFCKADPVKVDMFKRLKAEGFKIGVCSNCIRKTLKQVLQRCQLIKLCDVYLSNEDVEKPKPDPEIFLKAAISLGVRPEACMILEDSFYGLKAARASGAVVVEVSSVPSVTYELAHSFLNHP